MKILVAGYGFVGSVHALTLGNCQVYDPAKGYNDPIDDSIDAVIIAVATPQGQQGICDASNVLDVIKRVPNVPILIKSTVGLESWRVITELFPDRPITFSPEFLRQDYAMQDFKKQKVTYLGGGDLGFWTHVLKPLGTEFEYANPEELILAKYYRNAFLATKVIFFNQVHDMCNNAQVDPDKVIEIVSADKRIGKSHTSVTAERGFGGHCFPKDTEAILATARKYGAKLSLIREAVLSNVLLRKPK